MNFSVMPDTGALPLSHFAFLLTSISFFMKDILWLRGISIVSSSLLIFIGLSSGGSFFEAQTFWHFIFVCIHFWRGTNLVYQRHILKLNKFEEEIFNLFDKKILPKDIKRLIHLGVVENIDEDTLKIKSGERVDSIGLVLEGHCLIKNGESLLKDLKAGSFFGEFSFVTGNLASADVIVLKDSKVIFWDQGILKKFLKNNDSLLKQFQDVLMTKLMSNFNSKS